MHKKPKKSDQKNAKMLNFARKRSKVPKNRFISPENHMKDYNNDIYWTKTDIFDVFDFLTEADAKSQKMTQKTRKCSKRLKKAQKCKKSFYFTRKPYETPQ